MPCAQAMPLLSAKTAAGGGPMSEEEAVSAALAASLAPGGGVEAAELSGDEHFDAAAHSPPQSGVSFAHITKLGFAATGELRLQKIKRRIPTASRNDHLQAEGDGKLDMHGTYIPCLRRPGAGVHVSSSVRPQHGGREPAGRRRAAALRMGAPSGRERRCSSPAPPAGAAPHQRHAASCAWDRPGRHALGPAGGRRRAKTGWRLGCAGRRGCAVAKACFSSCAA